MSEFEARLMGNVHEFCVNPAELLQHWKLDLLDEDPDTETLVNNVVDEIEAVYNGSADIAHTANQEMNEVALSFLASEKDSPDYYRNLLQLLRDAGYSPAEVLTWVELSSTATTPAEMLEDRSLRVLFNEVYGLAK